MEFKFENGLREIIIYDFKDLPGIEKDAKVLHYTSEIIRYKSKINYVIKKVNRSLSNIDYEKIIPDYVFAYIVYMIMWEKYYMQELFDKYQRFKALVEIKSLSQKYFLKLYERIKSFKFTIALKHKDWKENLSIMHSFPSFFIDTLLPVMEKSHIKSLMDSMNSYDSSHVNFSILNKESGHLAIEALEKYYSAQGKEIPLIFNDTNTFFDLPAELKPIIIASPYFQNNQILIHSKSSYHAVQLLEINPDEPELILDLCSAPGVKSTIISLFMHKNSKLIRNDVKYNRLTSMREYSQDKNSNQNYMNSDGINPSFRNEENMFDKILLDAPCTGSGTFLHHPELKWRQGPNFLRQNRYFQKELLTTALHLLKPGGTLVYCVCSVYPEEGEYLIQDFINQDKCKMVEILDESINSIPKGYEVKGKIIEGTRRTFSSLPTYDSCFFYAKLTK